MAEKDNSKKLKAAMRKNESDDINREKENSVSENDKSLKRQPNKKEKVKFSGFKKNSSNSVEYVEGKDSEVLKPEILLSKGTLSVNKDTLVANRKKIKVKNHPVDLSKAERYTPEITEGLSSEQVEKRLNDGYVNINLQKNGRTYFGIILSNIFTFFNILTFIVAAALIVAGVEITQLFFLVIIIANIVIGLIQEIKAKYSVDKLSLVTAPSAQVIRDGQCKTISVDEVVLDDIIFLETGKQICSDCILLSGEIEVNEALLTGESENVRKSPGDILYSGSFLVSGKCYARIDKVGSENYVNKLASNAKKYRKPKSELNDSIRLIIKIASIFIIPSAIASFAVAHYKNGLAWDKSVINTSGAVIGMIPAGMFLLTSMALAVSVIKLARKRTLVQDLYCIEMLARIDVLCLDKTGTLTDGTMNVSKIIKVMGEENPSAETVIGSMLTATEDNNQTAIALAKKFGYNKELSPTQILPFNSQRKFSAVTFEGLGTYLLGAPEFIIKNLDSSIEQVINEYAKMGYRVLCLAHSDAEIVDKKVPIASEVVCLIMLEDHIREDALATIQWFKENDVAIKIISGDNPVTVSEVARRVGVENAEMYISLDGMSDKEIVELADQYTVFGRVTPEQKSLLVKALKSKGHTVAMTGDGVNDILAMREADCAVAIASGSEAARNVSHIVLLDSNFTSMPDIVFEGRRVVNNIQKSSSLFLMKTLMSIVLTIIFLIMGQTYPLQPNNLFFLEFFIIGLPSFFLALQPNKNRIRGKFLSNVISRAVPGGLALALTVLAVYAYSHNISIDGSNFSKWLEGIGADRIDTFVKTMIVFSLSLTGFMCLCKICEPFNYFRALLVTAMFIIMTIIFFSFGNYFGLGTINLGNPAERAFFFFDIAVCFASYFIVSIVMKLLKQFNVMYD